MVHPTSLLENKPSRPKYGRLHTLWNEIARGWRTDYPMRKGGIR